MNVLYLCEWAFTDRVSDHGGRQSRMPKSLGGYRVLDICGCWFYWVTATIGLPYQGAMSASYSHAVIVGSYITEYEVTQISGGVSVSQILSIFMVVSLALALPVRWPHPVKGRVYWRQVYAFGSFNSFDDSSPEHLSTRGVSQAALSVVAQPSTTFDHHPLSANCGGWPWEGSILYRQ